MDPSNPVVLAIHLYRSVPSIPYRHARPLNQQDRVVPFDRDVLPVLVALPCQVLRVVLCLLPAQNCQEHLFLLLAQVGQASPSFRVHPEILANLVHPDVHFCQVALEAQLGLPCRYHQGLLARPAFRVSPEYQVLLLVLVLQLDPAVQ